VTTSGPLPSGPAAEGSAAPGRGGADRRSRARETQFVAVVGISVGLVGAVVLAALLVAAPPAPAPTASGAPGTGVQISQVEWDLAGFPCSGDPQISTAPGTTVGPGTDFTENDSLVNAATLGSCTFSAPAVPAGFSVVTSNLPLTLTAGQNATLTVEVAAPAAAWSGTLVVSVGVSTAF
jgi:hypothetical protein